MEEIGGFRMVRRLGAGPRSEVYLGHPIFSGAALDQDPRVIKVFRPTVTHDDIHHEIDMLTRVSSRHLVSLHDVATAPDGRPALVLTPVGVRKLSELVVGAARLHPGEVITAIAPIVRAIAELHEAEVCHGGVQLANVIFDRHGAPLLMGFGGARANGELHADTDGTATDLADLAVLIRCVWAVADGGEIRRVDELMRHLESVSAATGTHERRWLVELESRLHDLAEARPVRFDGHLTHLVAGASKITTTATAEIRRKAIEESSAVGERRASLDQARSQNRPMWLNILGIPTPLEEVVSAPIAVTAAKIRSSLRSVRRPVWIVASAVAIAVVAALIFVPAQNVVPARAAVDRSSTRVSPSSSLGPAYRPARSAPPEPGTDTTTPVDSRPDSFSEHDDAFAREHSETQAISADEPAAATAALLRLRSKCFATRSKDCLDRVDSAGSASWDSDRAELSRIMAGGEPSTVLTETVTDIVLVQRLGNSAIMTAADKHHEGFCTILVMKESSGWRLRDIILP